VSHITTPEDFRYPWYVRLVFWLQRRRYGRELEPARLWGRTPRVFLAMTLMYRALERKSSPLEPALRSLVQVRVSQINWCGFCIDMNSALSLARGIHRDKLEALGQAAESPVFRDHEKAALAYAESMTRGTAHGDAALVAGLQQHFNDDQIIELTALIAYQNLSSKFNAALGVPAQGFCINPAAQLDKRIEN
jgi:AhpD family alkylhydroperoxidase